MAVGWEYGANMLTKYLAECGQKTPLTAATCIDNPFDLEEAMRSSGYLTDFNQRHTDGLINILQCNKELFQGRGKGFDVEKALSASSIRDFEKAISMVSYGIDTIDEFYAKSSTRDVVGKVEVPLLFIQNDDGKVPFFSIPRSLIAENPYTSLLLCSYKPSRKLTDDKFAFSWCQHLTLEWLTAVELGLLKGRHPLLKDVDVTINPSKGLALVERRDSSKKGRVDRLLNLTNGSPTNTQLEVSQANDTAKSNQSRSIKDMGQPPPITKGLQQEDSNISAESNAKIDEGINSLDSEEGQALKTAQVVFNVLDMTMPDALSDEKKKKVLNAVGQGETLLNALQDAVPEDVRGKLTTAVSGILESRRTDLKFDKLLSLGHIPEVASGLNSNFLDKNGPTKDNDDEDVHTLDQKGRIDGSGDGSSKVEHNSGKPPGDMELEKQPSEISQEQNAAGIDRSTSNHESNSPDSENANLNDTGNSYESEQSSGCKTAQISDREIASQINANQESLNMSNGPDGAEDVPVQKKVESGADNSQSDPGDKNNKQKDDLSNDQDKTSEAYKTEENTSASSSASEAQVIEHEVENSQKKEETGPMPVLSQNISDPPSFSVSQALYALTGFDDSAQVAVNSVFHVIEDMIDNFEVEKDKENFEVEKDKVDGMKNENNEEKEGSISKKHLTENDPKSAGTIDLRTNARNQVETESEISLVPAAGEIQMRNFVNSLYRSSRKVPNYVTTLPYGDPYYKEYLKTYLSLKMKSEKPLNMDKTSELYLDYIPEEGQWKLLEQAEDNIVSGDEYATRQDDGESQTDSQPRSEHNDNIIEPSYVILGSGEPQDHNEELKKDSVNENMEFDEAKFDDPMLLIKILILECLNVEVGRRASGFNVEDLEKLAKEIEYVANAVSDAAGKGRHDDNLPGKLSILDGENIIRVISSSVQDTQCLRKVLPIGIVVGSCLAALRKFFNVATVDGGDEQTSALDQDYKKIDRPVQVGVTKIENKDKLTSLSDEKEGDFDLEMSKNNKVMVGAVTAALGASALLAHQPNSETPGPSNVPLKEKNSNESVKLDEISDKTHNNIVTSLAEKAFSVASPVVPVKEDGEVDHERLVAMLTDLGQRGGILRLVGKVALLWGGIRGAMSLADKLMSFLHIADRPLFQRIPGFVFMVLLLWSPVVLPLLPTLMQSWATHNPFKIAEFACIVGLYVSIMIMITLWGKRVRKYDDPLMQYGLDLDSVSKLQNFLKGLVGGTILVVLIYTVHASLGCANLCWPTNLSSSSLEPIALMKSYGRLLQLITQGVTTATAIAVVEELFFRSWLPQEIATDFGYHRGVFISGLLFAFSQRSIWEVPGLWLLSLSLSGARQRSGGSLTLPIGFRAGILASSFILKMGGFLKYQINFPLWVTGGLPFQPFSGVVGLAFSLVLAVIFYPRQPLFKKTTRVIQE
ncbi:hypothetical protein ACS0TY_023984 [Phlomoides rotata]